MNEKNSNAIKRPCEECPFRADSNMRYDADAMEALNEGNEPSCHKIVGLESIFINAPLTPSSDIACIGFHAWIKRRKGFIKPRVEKVTKND